MAIHVDSIPALQALVAAADARSFKAAGQNLGLTSSAIGKSIARLELQLGISLFHRTTRTISLTDEGQGFLEHARRVLVELEAAESELAESASTPRGRLKVSLPVTGPLLTPVLGRFTSAYPDVSLDLDYSDRLVEVIEEGFDAVIRTGEPRDTRLLHRKLGSFPWHLVAAPAYLRHRKAPKVPKDLSKHVCLRQRVSSGRISPWPLRSQAAFEAPVSHALSIIEPLLELTLSGYGIGAFPSFLVKDHLRSGALLPVLERELERSSDLYILWPASRYRTPKVRAFVDFMAKGVKQALG